MKALGVPVGSQMAGNLLQSICGTSEHIPVCSDDVDRPNCFSPEENLVDLMSSSYCGSTSYWSNPQCSHLHHVFAYKSWGKWQGLKVENETDYGVSWVESRHSRRDPGDPAFFALCAYIVPTTTTTTTTTSTTVTTTTMTTTTVTTTITTTTTTETTTPTSISEEEMVDFLSPRVECPLGQSEEHEETGEKKSETNLPAIDLFLNPVRARELTQIQSWVEEMAESNTLTEVAPILLTQDLRWISFWLAGWILPEFWQIKCMSTFFVIKAVRQCRKTFGRAFGQDLLISQSFFRKGSYFGLDHLNI